jgi:hypothetical protein
LVVGEKEEEEKNEFFFFVFVFFLPPVLHLFISFSLQIFLFFLPLLLLTSVVVHLVDDHAEAVPFLRGDAVVAASPTGARRRRRRQRRRLLPPPLLLFFALLLLLLALLPLCRVSVKGQKAEVGPVAQEVAVGEDRVGLRELGVDEGHRQGQVRLAGVLFEKRREREKREKREVEVEVRSKEQRKREERALLTKSMQRFFHSSFLHAFVPNSRLGRRCPRTSTERRKGPRRAAGATSF